MKIRYFLGIAIIYTIAIAGYTLYVTSDYYTLENALWLSINVTLPIAAWISLPTCLLFIIACLFMLINTIAQKLKLMQINRDAEKLIVQIQEQSLGNDIAKRTFSTDNFKNLSKIISRFYLLPNLQSNMSGNEKIDSDFHAFNEIQNGIENTKIKLNTKHPLYKYNIKNSLHNDPQKSLEILKHDLTAKSMASQFYEEHSSKTIYDKAWDIIIESNTKNVQKALNLSQPHLTFDTILHLTQACVQGKIQISKETLIQTYKNVTLSEREYLALAIEICKMLNENNINFWLDVFEQLSKEVEVSVFAYFYMLLEVGKTNEAMDLKEQYPKNDFLPVSAFIHLKEKGYPLLVFFDPLLYRLKKANNIGNTKLLNPKISH